MAATPRPSRAKYFMWWLNLLGRLVSQNPTRQLHVIHVIYVSIFRHMSTRHYVSIFPREIDTKAGCFRFTVHHLQSTSLCIISSPVHCAPSPVHFIVHHLQSTSLCIISILVHRAFTRQLYVRIWSWGILQTSPFAALRSNINYAYCTGNVAFTYCTWNVAFTYCTGNVVLITFIALDT